MGGGSAAAAAAADLLRWCHSVTSRDRREPPPVPELWGNTKVDKDVLLARELHLAGAYTRSHFRST
jgi:hypothetical protein